MKFKAAVLRQMGVQPHYAERKPLSLGTDVVCLPLSGLPKPGCGGPA